MSYPAYPEYKDSGAEWLGEVPVHWEVKPLKRAIASVESGTSVNAADVPAVQGGKGVLKTSCVYRGWFDWRENKTVNQEDLGRVSCPVRKNTLIVSRMNTPELVGSAGLVVEAPDGIFLPDRLWQVSMQERCSPKYYYYFTRSPAYRDQVKIACAGTSSSMQNLGQDEFRAIWHPSPPLHEQQIIATFLDHETARIDALVEEQQRLIALLKEKRQAVISHAVTKGLDPDMPMRDSGVEWLGEVPEHWPQVRLKHVVSQIIDTEHKTVHFREDGEYLVVRTSNVRNGELILEGAKYTDACGYNEWTNRGRPQPGDVLFTREAPAGEACLVPHGVDLCLGQRMVLFIVKKARMDSQFLIYSIYAGLSSEFIESLSQGSTVVHFNMSDICNIPLFEPSLEEQESICCHLRMHLDCFDRLIEEASGSVELMKERRSALVSAAVTGKIDVRGWQPPAGSALATGEATQMEAV
ncbi:restriction endonuclease subunit S [Halovibrio sp. HP20-50]|uniref:restriction endonuclease subunit S n=1 Tax=Halovibrio sp. HP20-59 TaxID=3080275 RepID=UPI00294ADF11|nr:restriction endonuclease subunit S [Halovibrio sp. HP20-59]MEA2117567.1 restriction endonuclease subunit S [Halovibrio sp. HP20-59]